MNFGVWTFGGKSITLVNVLGILGLHFGANFIQGLIVSQIANIPRLALMLSIFA